ncbi:MAG: biotin transporter BioY [Calditrichia bacterium]
MLSLTSAIRSTIDRLRDGSLSPLGKLLTVFGFAAITAIGAKVEIAAGSVPTTLQTLGVYGSGLFLGPLYGFLSQLLYLIAGLFVPVTAGDGVGFAYITSRVSSGYLLAFPLVSALIGYCSIRWNSFVGSLISIEMGSLLLFFCGVNWLSAAIDDYSLWSAMHDGWFLFIPADKSKILLVALIYTLARKSFSHSDSAKT